MLHRFRTMFDVKATSKYANNLCWITPWVIVDTLKRITDKISVCVGHWQQSFIYEFVVVKVFQCNFGLHWVYKKSLSLDKKTDRDNSQIFLRPAPDKLKCTILISFLILLFEQVLTLWTACPFQIHWKLKFFLANYSGLCARKLWMKSSCSLL